MPRLVLESQAIQHVLDAVEHHPQFAADGEELPTFLDARPCLLAAETMDAGGDAVLFAGGENVLHRLSGRLGAGRFAVLAPHARRQIVGTDEDGVDARHRENVVGVLDRLNVLALQDDQDFLVGVLEIIDGGGAEIHGVDAAADAARTDRRIKGGANGVERLLPAIDHRYDDAVRSVVENALDVIVAIGRHARQGDAAGVGDGGEHVRRRLPIGVRMFDVHGQPGEAGAGQEARGHDTAQREPGADRGLAGLQGTFDGIGTHDVFLGVGDDSMGVRHRAAWGDYTISSSPGRSACPDARAR